MAFGSTPGETPSPARGARWRWFPDVSSEPIYIENEPGKSAAPIGEIYYMVIPSRFKDQGNFHAHTTISSNVALIMQNTCARHRPSQYRTSCCIECRPTVRETRRMKALKTFYDSIAKGLGSFLAEDTNIRFFTNLHDARFAEKDACIFLHPRHNPAVGCTPPLLHHNMPTASRALLVPLICFCSNGMSNRLDVRISI